MKYTNKEITGINLKEKRDYNFEKLYEHAHSELSLQQTKRDQIISLYITLCTFVLPFTLSQSAISLPVKGILFLVLSLVGFLMSSIITRYRVYKEVYWACCQCISCLQNFDANDINKEIVQAMLYQILKKKSSSFIKIKANGKVDRVLFFKQNIFSAETIYYVIHSLLVSIIGGLGLGLSLVGLFPHPVYNILVGLALGLLIFDFLIRNYFKNLRKVYQVIVDDEDSSFNWTFSKAWFLHFYM